MTATSAGSSGYFSQEEGLEPTDKAFVARLDSKPIYQLAEGITVRAISGHQCMVNLVEMSRGGEAPLHRHAEEQIVLVLEGAVRFEIDGLPTVVSAGEAIVIPSWVGHRAVGDSDLTRTVEVFAPPRAALLDLMGELANVPPPRSSGDG